MSFGSWNAFEPVRVAMKNIRRRATNCIGCLVDPLAHPSSHSPAASVTSRRLSLAPCNWTFEDKAKRHPWRDFVFAIRPKALAKPLTRILTRASLRNPFRTFGHHTSECAVGTSGPHPASCLFQGIPERAFGEGVFAARDKKRAGRRAEVSGGHGHVCCCAGCG